ncbi:hypothetical protein BV25DRAFT_1830736 [Artomyces pyxidatus]|uniref:Uncharacterized protein n=1 Tax=Artomyces pyxidatus TaxID=48021 RepID=A0ACB8SMM2_9AGAM|nr:hypothetical protein BV25DRAFT_1830736 [Artomyces pyxidatus]
MTSPMANGDSNVYGLPNGSASSSSSSSPTSPMTPSFLRLPYALISPDIYSHSDGVNRMSLSRHELVLQYTPSNHPSSFHNPSSKIVRGKFTRAYRWGSLDVLDHNHSDFLPLRQAVFHHMQTLQKYTREYLFDKFRVEFIMQQRPNSRDSIASHLLQNSGPSQLQIVSSRPVHTIDAPPSHGKMSRHPSVSVSRQMPLGDGHAPPAPPALSDSGQENAKVSSSKSNRQRAKKITVACNFCRSRKLKCDGGRPACHQCLKRSNPCDYMAPQKRRGGIRQRRHYGNSDSENGSGDDPSLDMDPSESPEVMSKPLNRVNSGPEQQIPHHESMQHQFSQREDAPVLPPLNSQGPRSEPILPTALDRRAPPMLDGHDRPNLPSLSFPSPPGIGASAPPMLPPMRSTEEGSQPPTPTSAPTAPQGGQTQRKRASTVSGKGNRSSSNYGPKVVACNYCRARKTKCDGAHPTCSSCARRSLACNYVNDPNMPGPRRKTSNAHSEPASASSNGQSSSHAGPSSSASMYSGDGYLHAYDEESGQEREYADDEPPSKRIRIEGSAATSPVAVLGMP